MLPMRTRMRKSIITTTMTMMRTATSAATITTTMMMTTMMRMSTSITTIMTRMMTTATNAAITTTTMMTTMIEDEHEHHHDGECCCGHHHHHHDHDADEVFTSWGHETAHKYSHDELESILTTLDSGEYGAVLRAKGIVDGGDTWYEFDMVPGEHEIRTCGPRCYRQGVRDRFPAEGT